MNTKLANAMARWLKFNLVGALGVGVQLGVLVLLTKAWHFGYLFATALAVEAAVLHNFVWHEKFTWVNKDSGCLSEALRRFWWFHASNGIMSIGGNLLLMRWLVGHLHVRPILANLLCIAACSLANFLACDNWVFRHSHNRALCDRVSFRLEMRGSRPTSLVDPNGGGISRHLQSVSISSEL